MKAAALALLLLAPMAGAFPSVTFSGTMEYEATDALVLVDGIEVLNGTAALSLPVADGSHAWSITAGNLTVNGTTVALNVSALLQAVASQAANAAVAGVPAPDLSSMQGAILEAIAAAQPENYATKADVDAVASEFRSLRTRDETTRQEDLKAQQDRMEAVENKLAGKNAGTAAVIGLVLATLGLGIYREVVALRDRPAVRVERDGIRALMLNAGLTEESVAEILAMDAVVPEDEPEHGELVE